MGQVFIFQYRHAILILWPGPCASNEGAAYHIISRSNARAVERYHWICRACCLMSNHYHLQGRYKAILVEKDGRSWSGIPGPGGGAVTGPPLAMRNPAFLTMYSLSFTGSGSGLPKGRSLSVIAKKVAEAKESEK